MSVKRARMIQMEYLRESLMLRGTCLKCRMLSGRKLTTFVRNEGIIVEQGTKLKTRD